MRFASCVLLLLLSEPSDAWHVAPAQQRYRSHLSRRAPTPLNAVEELSMLPNLDQSTFSSIGAAALVFAAVVITVHRGWNEMPLWNEIPALRLPSLDIKKELPMLQKEERGQKEKERRQNQKLTEIKHLQSLEEQDESPEKEQDEKHTKAFMQAPQPLELVEDETNNRHETSNSINDAREISFGVDGSPDEASMEWLRADLDALRKQNDNLQFKSDSSVQSPSSPEETTKSSDDMEQEPTADQSTMEWLSADVEALHRQRDKLEALKSNQDSLPNVEEEQKVSWKEAPLSNAVSSMIEADALGAIQKGPNTSLSTKERVLPPDTVSKEKSESEMPPVDVVEEEPIPLSSALGLSNEKSSVATGEASIEEEPAVPTFMQSTVNAKDNTDKDTQPKQGDARHEKGLLFEYIRAASEGKTKSTSYKSLDGELDVIDSEAREGDDTFDVNTVTDSVRQYIQESANKKTVYRMNKQKYERERILHEREEREKLSAQLQERERLIRQEKLQSVAQLDDYEEDTTITTKSTVEAHEVVSSMSETIEAPLDESFVSSVSGSRLPEFYVANDTSSHEKAQPARFIRPHDPWKHILQPFAHRLAKKKKTIAVGALAVVVARRVVVGLVSHGML